MDHSILQASADELSSAEGKVTYVGPQEKPIPTVIFSREGHGVELDIFTTIQHGNKKYKNDELSNVLCFNVTPDEFKRILLATTGILKGSPASGRPGFLSFAVIRKLDGKFIGEEFLISRNEGPGFYEALRGALDEKNVVGKSVLLRQRNFVLPGLGNRGEVVHPPADVR